jgi:hypothetical protein
MPRWICRSSSCIRRSTDSRSLSSVSTPCRPSARSIRRSGTSSSPPLPDRRRPNPMQRSSSGPQCHTLVTRIRTLAVRRPGPARLVPGLRYTGVMAGVCAIAGDPDRSLSLRPAPAGSEPHPGAKPGVRPPVGLGHARSQPLAMKYCLRMGKTQRAHRFTKNGRCGRLPIGNVMDGRDALNWTGPKDAGLAGRAQRPSYPSPCDHR